MTAHTCIMLTFPPVIPAAPHFIRETYEIPENKDYVPHPAYPNWRADDAVLAFMPRCKFHWGL